MSIVLAIVGSIIILFLALALCSIDDIDATVSAIIICGAWCFIGLGLIGCCTASSSYKTNFYKIPIQQTMRDFDNNINFLLEGNLRHKVSELKYIELENAKFLIVEKDFKNLYGSLLDHKYKIMEKESLELYKNNRVVVREKEFKNE